MSQYTTAYKLPSQSLNWTYFCIVSVVPFLTSCIPPPSPCPSVRSPTPSFFSPSTSPSYSECYHPFLRFSFYTPGYDFSFCYLQFEWNGTFYVPNLVMYSINCLSVHHLDLFKTSILRGLFASPLWLHLHGQSKYSSCILPEEQKCLALGGEGISLILRS